MTSYATIEEARAAREKHPQKGSITGIVEIVPSADDVKPYIMINCTLNYFRVALRDNPIAGIKSIVGMAVDFAAERSSTLRAAVPGLDELRAALNDSERHYQESLSRFDSEYGTCHPVRPVAVDPEKLAEKYPAAAAYIKAENWASASNDVKSTAGTRAMKRIEAGENHETVIAEMETAWRDYCLKNVD